MITKFILIVAFASGYGPSVYYEKLGEFKTLQACQAAAAATKKAANDINLSGHQQPKFICASVGDPQ